LGEEPNKGFWLVGNFLKMEVGWKGNPEGENFPGTILKTLPNGKIYPISVGNTEGANLGNFIGAPLEKRGEQFFRGKLPKRRKQKVF